MGYEVIYYYHERMPDGRWDVEHRHEMRKKIGGPTDEVDVEKLAAIILGQLAKRDKLVVDVDIYEYVRRQVSYKEAADGSGIILKGKKFSAGVLAGQLVAEDVEEPASQPTVPMHRRAAPTPTPASGRPRSWMVFEPEPHQLAQLGGMARRFTPGKKYAVYNSVPHPTGVGNLLTVADDKGQMADISECYFVANTQVRLVGDDEVEGGFDVRAAGRAPRLSYDNQYDGGPMPDLRPHLKG